MQRQTKKTSAEQVAQQLSRILAAGDDSVHEGYVLTESWEKAGVGAESIEPILRFMEEHPEVDYGMPGPLTHFVERFRDGSYERQLSQSILRKPTPHTVGMLSRLIKGVRLRGAEKVRYLRLMESVKRHPHADPLAIELAEEHLQWHASPD